MRVSHFYLKVNTMNELIQELKIRARLRHKSVLAGDHRTFERMRRRFPKETEFKLKHSLHLVAYENGFKDWPMALRYLGGRSEDTSDAGSFWYASSCMTLLNNWFANFEEARSFFKDGKGKFLIPYKHQFIVVDENYMSLIGCEAPLSSLEDTDLVSSYGGANWRKFAKNRIGMN